MSDISRMNINIGAAGDDQQKSKRPQPKIVTLEKALAYVRSRNFDPAITDEIIKRLSRYPSNTLNTALKNLSKIVTEITLKLREENNDDPKENRVNPTAYDQYKSHPFFDQKDGENGTEENEQDIP